MAVAWPKGVVHEPSSQEQMGFFLRDNVAAAIGLIWLAVLLGFYLWAWSGWAGTRPPAPLSPVRPARRFFAGRGALVSRMGYDDKAFAAAVVDMAVKGCC